MKLSKGMKNFLKVLLVLGILWLVWFIWFFGGIYKSTRGTVNKDLTDEKRTELAEKFGFEDASDMITAERRTRDTDEIELKYFDSYGELIYRLGVGSERYASVEDAEEKISDPGDVSFTSTYRDMDGDEINVIELSVGGSYDSKYDKLYIFHDDNGYGAIALKGPF